MKKDENLQNINFRTTFSLCNFKSFRRFLIYIFHLSGYINLREVNSEQITNKELVSILGCITDYKIKKKDLCKIIKCSNNTLNKKLSNYFTENELNGRRKFTVLETYGILNEWQGKGKWVPMEAIKKKQLAEIISSGDYKKLGKELMKFGKENYKNIDKFSPNEAKQIFEHIHMSESDEAKEFLGEINTGISIWIFVLILTIHAWEKQKLQA